MENASKALIIAGAILIAILLISIGIILINSGKDVTSTGTQGMQSQKIQTFNSQFTAYEGTRKGSEIKSLVNVINASNATDSEHQVWLSETCGRDNINSISDLVNTKDYTVTVFYAVGSKKDDDSTMQSGRTILVQGTLATEKGYICRINIK